MRKGSVWLADVPPGVGHEQMGPRPVVVVGTANGLVTVVPLTTNTRRANFSHTHLLEPSASNGLDAPSVALVFQIKSLDQSRLKRKAGTLSSTDMAQIDALMADLLGLA